MTKQNLILVEGSLKLANYFVGWKEATGKNDGAFVNMLQEWLAGPSEHGQPWCALFATFCIHTSAAVLGITPMLPRSDSSTELYEIAKRYGLLLDQPEHGCLALKKGDGGTTGKDHHHTNRVISIDFATGQFVSIDGNIQNQVIIVLNNKISDFDFVAVV